MNTTRQYRVPFGEKELIFQVPKHFKVFLAEAGKALALENPHLEVRRALDNPIGSKPIRELSQRGWKVCIVFTDSTRACPDELLISDILKDLEEAGVKREDITLLCGVGMHRPSTSEEKKNKLGERICSNYRVIDHDARNPEGLVELGKTGEGIPASVNKAAVEADILIATGIVEPHQYAGYSGGCKTLAVGAGGEPFIALTHGPAMVEREGTRLGIINGNPFQQAVQEAGVLAGLRFIINAVLDEEKRPVAIAAGDPLGCFSHLVEKARAIYEVAVPRQFDIAVAGVGHPKDVNLYQASRAVSYLFFAPTPVVRDGGVFIMPAPSPEGAGEGIGERRFLETMRRAKDMPALIRELREKGYPPGAQRAFVMAKVLEKTSVIVVGSQTPEIVRDLHMIPASDMDEALLLARRMADKDEPDLLIVPHALLTLPVVKMKTNKTDTGKDG
jgi:nickel-dependent lactate racemase